MVATAESRKIAEVLKHLRAAGYEPILVGGLALTLYGSDRVTFDCDFVTTKPQTLEEAKLLARAMHKAECYFVSRIDEHGRPVNWIDNSNIAAAKMMMDEPDTVFFWNPTLELKIDLLLDFPLKAVELSADAHDMKLGPSTRIKVACLKHLKAMKAIAMKGRKNPKDAQDMEFLKKRIK